MTVTLEIVAHAQSFASDHIRRYVDKRFVYHDLSHTEYVVSWTARLAKKAGLGKHERMLLAIAAWFHDTGYARQVEDNEQFGAQLAEDFLRQQGTDPEEIGIIRDCILATQHPQQPHTLLQQILCDADLLHLSDQHFMERSQQLREEWRLTKQLVFSDEDWLALNYDFLSKHRYHTLHAQKQREKKKEKNIALLYEMMRPKAGDKEEEPASLVARDPRLVNGKMERGVETLFKTASGNHMHLSGMADNKAHILLSINSIIISAVLSFLIRKLGEAPYLIVPTMLLLVVSITTIVFAVLATKPKVSKGVFTRDQILRREVNLLFFGNFHQMDLNTYEWAIEEMMYDKAYLYKSMTKDIYFLGKVLALKYRYLNIGYRVFMYGLSASVLAFAISLLFGGHAL